MQAAGSSPLSPLEFGSRHRPIHRSIAKPTISPFLFPPPFQSHLKLRLAVETYINSLHLFSSTLSLSLSPLFFGLPPSLFLLLAELITAPSRTKLRSQFQLTRNVYVYRTSRVARRIPFSTEGEGAEKMKEERENIHARENLIDFDSTRLPGQSS